MGGSCVDTEPLGGPDGLDFMEPTVASSDGRGESSGFAIRSPPRDWDRLRSPFMTRKPGRLSGVRGGEEGGVVEIREENELRRRSQGRRHHLAGGGEGEWVKVEKKERGG